MDAGKIKKWMLKKSHKEKCGVFILFTFWE
jgi:hypothetical protein